MDAQFNKRYLHCVGDDITMTLHLAEMRLAPHCFTHPQNRVLICSAASALSQRDRIHSIPCWHIKRHQQCHLLRGPS